MAGKSRIDIRIYSQKREMIWQKNHIICQAPAGVSLPEFFSIFCNSSLHRHKISAITFHVKKEMMVYCSIINGSRKENGRFFVEKLGKNLRYRENRTFSTNRVFPHPHIDFGRFCDNPASIIFELISSASIC